MGQTSHCVTVSWPFGGGGAVSEVRKNDWSGDSLGSVMYRRLLYFLTPVSQKSRKRTPLVIGAEVCSFFFFYGSFCLCNFLFK